MKYFAYVENSSVGTNYVLRWQFSETSRLMLIN